MNNEDLPAYKKQFLQEMEILRQQKLQEEALESPSIIAQKQALKYFWCESDSLQSTIILLILLCIAAVTGGRISIQAHTVVTMIWLTTS